MAYNVNKVLKIAKAEIGYLEKYDNRNLDDKTANAGKNNYTKYWRDLSPSMNGQSWCNCFVNWCFVQAYGEVAARELLCTTGGWSFYTPTSASYFQVKGQWFTSPMVGDIIYFKNATRIHHVGIVTKVDGGTVYTIEGNTSIAAGVVANGGGVNAKQYSIGSSSIAGYGRPNYNATIVTSKTKPVKYTGALPTTTIRNGNKGAEVKKLQMFLNWYGGFGLVTDGECGPKTVAAIKTFQKNEGLTVDGIFGAKSYKKACEIKK